MISDVNQPKSRAFNVHLRFLQLSLTLSATFLVGVLTTADCVKQQLVIVRGLGLFMIGLNVFAMIFIKFRPHHPKTAFLVFFGIDVICAISILVFTAINYKDSQWCPILTFYYIYYLSAIPVYLIISAMAVAMPFYWAQRFTNSPGMIVWAVMLFVYAGRTYKWGTMLVIMGVLMLVASILTWIGNGLALLNGVSTVIKKLIVISFIISLTLILIAEILGVVGVFSIKIKNYNSLFLHSVFQTFVFVNGIDFLFWLLGLMSLQYQNGDAIRDGLLQYGIKDDTAEAEEDNGERFYRGTLRQ